MGGEGTRGRVIPKGGNRYKDWLIQWLKYGMYDRYSMHNIYTMYSTSLECRWVGTRHLQHLLEAQT